MAQEREVQTSAYHVCGEFGKGPNPEVTGKKVGVQNEN